jgi:hypothetical protein
MQWHTAVIPATQEAKAGKSQVQGHPGNVSKTLSQKPKYKTKAWDV